MAQPVLSDILRGDGMIESPSLAVGVRFQFRSEQHGQPMSSRQILSCSGSSILSL